MSNLRWNIVGMVTALMISAVLVAIWMSQSPTVIPLVEAPELDNRVEGGAIVPPIERQPARDGCVDTHSAVRIEDARNLDAAAADQAITLECRDGDNSPVQGAFIWLIEVDPGNGPSLDRLGTTGSDGRFRWVPPVAGSVPVARFEATLPRREIAGVSGWLCGGETGIVRMVSGCCLVVRVFDGNGPARAFVKLRASPRLGSDAVRQGVADDDGRALFVGLEPGRYVGQVVETECGFRTAEIQELEVKSGVGVVVVDLGPRAKRTIRVMDEKRQIPKRISVKRLACAPVGPIPVDADGRVIVPEFSLGIFEIVDEVGQSALVRFSNGALRPTEDGIVILRPHVVVSGTVAGTDAARCLIEAVFQRETERGHVIYDRLAVRALKDGTFRLDRVPARSVFVLQCWAPGGLVHKAVRGVTGSGADITRVTITLELGAELAIRVRDMSGASIERARVAIALAEPVSSGGRFLSARAFGLRSVVRTDRYGVAKTAATRGAVVPRCGHDA